MFRQKTIYSPPSVISGLSALMLKQEHILIGGTTGAGKSVLLNTFVSDAVLSGALFYLVDPKTIELKAYRKLPTCVKYVRDVQLFEEVVDDVFDNMERRFKKMDKEENVKMCSSAPIYLVIDEYADIKLRLPNINKVECKLMNIVSKGRAANVHVVLLTQRCTNDILNNKIKAMFTCNIGLRTRNAQESRNIIGENGCEKLPRYGKCIFCSPDFMTSKIYDVPMYSHEEIKSKIEYFTDYNIEMRKKEKTIKLKFLGKLTRGLLNG